MPPTRAAARNTYSGRFRPNHSKTRLWSFNSKVCLSTVGSFSKPRVLHNLTKDEPTRPLCPATNIFEFLFMVCFQNRLPFPHPFSINLARNGCHHNLRFPIWLLAHDQRGPFS